ncbi:MAG: hypothetical protein ACI3VN_03025 [Candidatus Onthomonas sp.]
MMKRLSALLMALLLALSSLTGCSSKAAEEFYQTGEELAATEDALVNLVIPYHGANLLVNGYICRSSQTADLIFTLEGAGSGDGVWTELRVDENQLWLNVAQLAQRTLAFDLPALRRGDIEDLQRDQTANWVSYTWNGDFWAGIPGWGELLKSLWEGCKPDLNSHISGRDGNYTLELNGKDLQTAEGNLLRNLIDETGSFRESFLSWAEQQPELIRSTQMEADLAFDSYWTDWSDRLETVDSRTDGSLTLTISKSESSYGLAWICDGGDGWSVTVTPTGAQPVEAPQEAMEFGAYADCIYYLLDFSNSYIGDVLDGIEMDPELEQIFQQTDETDVLPEPEPMETGTAVGFDDLKTIQFVSEGGQARSVPILGSYLYNSVVSEDSSGARVTDLTLGGQGWYQLVYAEDSAGQESSLFLEESIAAYYDAYINLSGYLLVQDLTQQVSSDSGALAQGFSYREDDYSDTVAQILILLPREGNESYIVLDLELHLAEMSEADRAAAGHLLDYLGLELPLSLEP